MIKAAQMKIYDDAVTLIYSLLKCFFPETAFYFLFHFERLEQTNQITLLEIPSDELQSFNGAFLRKASQWLSHVGSTFSQLISIVKAHRVGIVLV